MKKKITLKRETLLDLANAHGGWPSDPDFSDAWQALCTVHHPDTGSALICTQP